MRVINLVVRDKDDPLRRVVHERYKLVTTPIDENNPLLERFGDTRTVYEQYCEGEKYLKYDDETLYSRAAHEYLRDEVPHQLFPKKNFDWRKIHERVK